MTVSREAGHSSGMGTVWLLTVVSTTSDRKVFRYRATARPKAPTESRCTGIVGISRSLICAIPFATGGLISLENIPGLRRMAAANGLAALLHKPDIPSAWGLDKAGDVPGI